jgi:ketosteroid isomerase-like protein
MPAETPRVVVDRLIAAIRSRDLDAVVALYEDEANVAIYPGMERKGTSWIREFFNSLFGLEFEYRNELQTLTEAGDLALFTAKWNIEGPIVSTFPIARTNYQSLVMRRQPDGMWLIAIDNPFGPAEPSD